jgi:general secretion pathway protein B
MSYILDALRRADAKRADALLSSSSGSSATRVVFADTQPYRQALPWPWIAGGCALLLVGVLAWHFWAPSAAGSGSGAQAPPAAAAAQAAPAYTSPALVTGPLNGLPAIADRPTPLAPATSAAKSSPVAAAPTGSVTAAAAAAAPAPGTTPTPTVGAVPAERRIYTLEELPADIRAELPKLTLGGSAYSDNPAHRLLILNGQVVREKDEAAAGLVLEQIQPKAAVLRYKGYRYLLPF